MTWRATPGWRFWISMVTQTGCVTGSHLWWVVCKYKYRHLSNPDNRVATIHPSAFDGLWSLEELDLSDNQLTALNHTWFKKLVALQTVNLLNNPYRWGGQVRVKTDQKHPYSPPGFFPPATWVLLRYSKDSTGWRGWCLEVRLWRNWGETTWAESPSWRSLQCTPTTWRGLNPKKPEPLPSALPKAPSMSSSLQIWLRNFRRHLAAGWCHFKPPRPVFNKRGLGVGCAQWRLLPRDSDHPERPPSDRERERSTLQGRRQQEDKVQSLQASFWTFTAENESFCTFLCHSSGQSPSRTLTCLMSRL